MSVTIIRDRFGVVRGYDLTREDEPEAAHRDHLKREEIDSYLASPQHKAGAEAATAMALTEMTTSRMDLDYLCESLDRDGQRGDVHAMLAKADQLGLGVLFRHNLPCRVRGR